MLYKFKYFQLQQNRKALPAKNSPLVTLRLLLGCAITATSNQLHSIPILCLWRTAGYDMLAPVYILRAEVEHGQWISEINKLFCFLEEGLYRN
jgi:hypothetical protein